MSNPPPPGPQPGVAPRDYIPLIYRAGVNRLEHCTPALLRRIADVLEQTHSGNLGIRTVAVEMHDDIISGLVAPPEGEPSVPVSALHHLIDIAEGRPVIRAVG